MYGLRKREDEIVEEKWELIQELKHLHQHYYEYILDNELRLRTIEMCERQLITLQSEEFSTNNNEVIIDNFTILKDLFLKANNIANKIISESKNRKLSITETEEEKNTAIKNEINEETVKGLLDFLKKELSKRWNMNVN
jgi:hypothetical protein